MTVIALHHSGLPDLPAPSKGMWMFAVALALSFHLGFGAFAIWRFQAEPDDADLGAPSIAIGLDLAAPHLTPTELPPEQDSEASVSSSAAIEQKTAVEAAELPKETPVESDQPDRIVTLNDVKSVTEETPEVAAQHASPAKNPLPKRRPHCPVLKRR